METETMCSDEGIAGSTEFIPDQTTENMIENFTENSLQTTQDLSSSSLSAPVLMACRSLGIAHPQDLSVLVNANPPAQARSPPLSEISKSIEISTRANSIKNTTGNNNGSGAIDTGDNEEDDLEDGEIETDDDESEPVITAVVSAAESQIQDVKNSLTKANSSSPVPSKSLSLKVSAGSVTSPNVEQHSPTIVTGKKRKYQRMDIHDDFAGDIENAIAAALKKEGIEPSKSKRPALENYDRALEKAESSGLEEGGSRRGRIRKKREEREKNKLKRLKRLLETTDVNDIDEDEMVCVRGGSPPPMPKDYLTPMDYRPSPPPRHAELYDSDDSNPSSYDSYDSAENRKMSYDERRQSRRKRDRRNRAGTNQTSGSTGGRGGGNKRRNRNESDGDDCPRSHDARAPRKLELCKFYLMDCCAKKEKCSYMHADFPCKYYYLGMDCVYKTECKFSHGDPLTEQLKNILLKHIETAPKEILGSFRRISRETATNMLLTTHAKLCADKGIENTLELPSSSQSSLMSTSQSFRRESRSPSVNRSGSVGRGSGGGGSNPFASSAPTSQTTPAANDEDDWDKEDWDKPAEASPSTTAANNSCTFNSNKLAEKLRKSRWCDTLSLQSGGSQSQSTASDILSLRNLKGVITHEQIERLEEIGIENLEQISQLTVAQLNSVGLTIGQIHEIQLNALNIQKLGLITHNTPSNPVIISPITSAVNPISSSTSTISAPQSQPLFSDDGSAMSQDVDMRVLVGAVQASGTATTSQQLAAASQMSESSIVSAVATTVANSQTLHDIGIGSPEPTPNSGKLGSMDLSQYLKDSNVKDADKTNFNDLLKEDKEDDDALNEDEPELLIDESRCAGSDDENDVSKRSGYDSSPLNSPKAVIATPAPIVYASKGEDDDNWDDDDGAATTTSAPATQTSSFADSQPSTSEYRSEDDFYSTSAANKYDNNSDSWDQGGGGGGGGPSGRDRWQNKGPKNHDSRGYKNPNDRNNRRQRNKKDSWQSEDTWQAKSSPSDFYGSSSDPRNDGYGSAGGGSHRDDFHGNRNQSRNDQRSNIGMDQSYDNKDFWADGAGGAGTNQFRDPRLMGNSGGGGGGGSSFFGSNDNRNQAKHNAKPVSNYDCDWDAEDEAIVRPARKESMSMTITHQDVIPPIVKEPSPPPKYQRASIYDGSGFGDDDGTGRCADDEDREFSSDRDMRVPSFLDSGDIDLRLPFKPVMTNYTPATEIDGSISSHPPIAYKVSEVSIPKPDYSEIRRTMTVTEKTLDPRLRRIFCLKEPVNDQYASDSEMIKSPPHTASLLVGSQKMSMDPVEKVGGMTMSGSLGGPRMDPRRRKENLESMLIKPMTTSTGITGLGQNVDIRMLLQKSVWYKNLNSKFKIMVNQQLALVSTELKKFHQDPNPEKVFDMKFIATNQYLQQVLTNLGIFIDGNGQILQLDGENDDGMSGPPGPPMIMPGSGPMMDPISPISMNMDFMRRPQSGGMMTMTNPRFMGHANMMGSFGAGFGGDIRPGGMLRVQPTLNPFANMQGNQFHPADCLPGNRPNNYGGNDQYNAPPNDKNPFKQQGGRNDWGGGGGGGGGGRRSKKPPRGGGGGGGGDDDYDSNRGFNDRHYGPPPQKNNDGMMGNKKDDYQQSGGDFYSSNKSNDGGGFYSKSASVTPPAPTNDEEECWD